MILSDIKATLSFSDNSQSINMPVYKGTLGPNVIDIRNLYKSTGLFTYDPGFISTASCKSKITYIDTENSRLFYRGHSIEYLVKNNDFLDVCYLLLNEEIPNISQKNKFIKEILRHSVPHEQIKLFFNGFNRNAHPMAMLLSIVGSLSGFYYSLTDIKNLSNKEIEIIIIAQLPTIIAMLYKYKIGESFLYPKNNLSYSANFMYMMFSKTYEDYIFNKAKIYALDRILTLHADHEQNASTSTVRLVGSSGSNLFACISAGIACLWGPAHGGANEAVLNMLKNIGKSENINKFLNKVKQKDSSIKLMGFGHRIYKNYDPRAKLMRDICDNLFHELGIPDDPLFTLAKNLESIALKDDYFISRKLCPNIDFYSGIAQHIIGIPSSMFTCIFAMSRIVGWIAQWKEMIMDSDNKIGRPRQLYIGNKLSNI